MKARLFVLFFFVAVSSSTQQAPTSIEGCREAFRSIRSEVPLDIGNRTIYLRRVSITDLTEKSFVMASCGVTDAENAHMYMVFDDIFGAEIHQRYQHFVERHRLVNQLLKEDSAGER
jgi:stress-induced morphogen